MFLYPNVVSDRLTKHGNNIYYCNNSALKKSKKWLFYGEMLTFATTTLECTVEETITYFFLIIELLFSL